MTKTFSATVFKDAKTQYGEIVELPLIDFIDDVLFQKNAPIVTEGMERAEIDIVKQGTSAWSQFLFDDNHRKNSKSNNVMQFFIMDIDSHITINEAEDRLMPFGVFYVIAPSSSHQITKDGKKCDRFRVVIPFADPVPFKSNTDNIAVSNKDILSFSHWLEQYFGFEGVCDESVYGNARIFFKSSSELPIDAFRVNGVDKLFKASDFVLKWESDREVAREKLMEAERAMESIAEADKNISKVGCYDGVDDIWEEIKDRVDVGFLVIEDYGWTIRGGGAHKSFYNKSAKRSVWVRYDTVNGAPAPSGGVVLCNKGSSNGELHGLNSLEYLKKIRRWKLKDIAEWFRDKYK